MTISTDQTPEPKKPLRQESLTPRRVAAILGCHVETVRSMIRTGRLPAFKIAGRGRSNRYQYRIAVADVLEYRKRNRSFQIDVDER